MEEFFDIIIALAAIGAVIIRMAKKAQQKVEEQPVFKEEDVFFEDEEVSFEGKEMPRQKTETFNRTTRSTEYAKTQNVFVSTEGSESHEGKCIEKDANHCAVEHIEDSVYQTEISDEAPKKFNRESLVQGIIMAEILSKPKWME